MYRDIRFRAWDNKKKKMICPEEYFTGSVINLAGQCGKSSWQLMQFTGLEDKNGKEIYEGDVVESRDGDVYKIGFDFGSFGAIAVKDKSGRHFSDWHSASTVTFHEKEFKVIGNIYENPELLK